MIYEDLILKVDKEIESENNVIKLKEKIMLDLNAKIANLENEKASEIARIKHNHSKDKNMLIKCRKESRKQKKHACKKQSRKFQAKIQKYFTPIETEKEIENFITHHVGMCRYNITNKKWHEKNNTAAQKLFGFKSFDETISYISSFFTNTKLEHPKIVTKSKEFFMQPEHLTDFEQISIAIMPMQCSPQR